MVLVFTSSKVRNYIQVTAANIWNILNWGMIKIWIQPALRIHIERRATHYGR